MPSTVVRPRLLVVEDEAIVARDIQAQLLELGYDPVGHATRGDQAIAMAESLRPDLVLMDIQLAGDMDGVAAAQIIRTRFSLPVVFLTAFAADDVLERAKLAEPFGYILKPFSERELRTVLEMALYKYEADVRLKDTAAHTQAILDNMAEGVITIDSRGLIESFNQAACTVFGYSVEEVIGRNVSMLMPEPHHTHHDSYLAHYNRTGEARMVGIPREVEGMRNDGSIFPMNLSVSKITRAGHTTFIGLVRDLSEHQQDVEEIRRLAFYDPLTGLPNRRLLLDRLSQAMLTSARSGLHGALMFLDLDHFKRINDKYGHAVGDQALIAVANALQASARDTDQVSRFGGEEFLILMPEAHTERDGVPLAERLRAAIAELKLTGPAGEVITLTASFGVSGWLASDKDREHVLRRADNALYEAKDQGRDRVVLKAE